MRIRSFPALFLAALLALVSCGDNLGDNPPPPTQEPSYGIRVTDPMDSWVSGQTPYPTTQTSISLSGLAPLWAPQAQCDFSVPPPADVTWTNLANGATGTAFASVNATFVYGCLVGLTHWLCSVPLQPGLNRINLEARGEGNRIVGLDHVLVNCSPPSP